MRLKIERHQRSLELQAWIFDNYIVHNALGEQCSIRQIFSQRGLVPPGGTGDCAAPKLLEFAYRNQLKPLAMGEFWYGTSSHREVRIHSHFYPACTGKCGPLLSWMMRGLEVESNPLDKEFAFESTPEVIFQDEYLLVANKPSGMLSVPGRTEKMSLQEYLSGKLGTDLLCCHRLDMDTSGLIVLAKTMEVYTSIQEQFASRSVHKTYKARLIAEGNSKRQLKAGSRGTIALPLASDFYDRPRQIVDTKEGKRAITEYEILSVSAEGEIDVQFVPQTGRTHQLRVHAAHPDGLGHPIKGDRLYGGMIPGRDEPLHLQADSLRFAHPVTGEVLSFKL